MSKQLAMIFVLECSLAETICKLGLQTRVCCGVQLGEPSANLDRILKFVEIQFSPSHLYQVLPATTRQQLLLKIARWHVLERHESNLQTSAEL